MRFQRIWPLFLCLLGLAALVADVPIFLESLRYHFMGVRTSAWYSDFGPYYERGKPYFIYSYRIENLTYTGRRMFDDEHSSIYFRHIGDSLSVTYLRSEPWISSAEPVEFDLTISSIVAAVALSMLLVGIWLSVWRGVRHSADEVRVSA
jgi:hypothetical protein